MSTAPPLPLALMGCGRWGQKLLAAMTRHPQIDMRAVIERCPQAHVRAKRICPSAASLGSVSEVVDRGVRALVVATPSALHFAHASEGLLADCDVLVEKPQALTAREASRLIALAEQRQRIGMVGHVLRYDPRYEALARAVSEGQFGRLKTLRVQRMTRSASGDPLWMLLPHDLATLRSLDRSPLERLRAARSGGTIRVELQLASGLRAELSASTTAGSALRELELCGDHGTICIDELRPTAEPSAPDPLQRQLSHFVACVRRRGEPRTSFAAAAWIVQVIERIEQQLARGRGEASAASRLAYAGDG